MAATRSSTLSKMLTGRFPARRCGFCFLPTDTPIRAAALGLRKWNGKSRPLSQSLFLKASTTLLYPVDDVRRDDDCEKWVQCKSLRSHLTPTSSTSCMS